jgi:hypothetical protein
MCICDEMRRDRSLWGQYQKKRQSERGNRRKSVNGHWFPMPHLIKRGDKRVEMGFIPSVGQNLGQGWYIRTDVRRCVYTSICDGMKGLSLLGADAQKRDKMKEEKREEMKRGKQRRNERGKTSQISSSSVYLTMEASDGPNGGTKYA